MKAKERESNIELLRIFSMFLIVLFHLGYHGIILSNTFIESNIYINNIYLYFINILGKIGVNLFVLISGYFLVTKKKYNYKKILLFWLQILFYSIIIYLVLTLVFKDNSIRLIDALMPLSYKKWWFATTYFILYLIYPYINILINNLSKKDYKKLLIILTITLSIWPMMINKDIECNNLIWFIFLYLLGAYIKLYIKITYDKKWTIYALVSFIVALLLIIVLYRLKIDYNIIFGEYKYPTLLISIVLFLSFLNLKINNSKIINTIGKSTFGIYLLHDHMILKNYIWNKLFKVNELYYQKTFITKSIIIALIIFASFSLIEYIRMIIENKIILIIDKRKGETNEKEKISI